MEREIDILPFLKRLNISEAKWKEFQKLCKKNGQCIEDYLEIPVEQEIENVIRDPSLLYER